MPRLALLTAIIVLSLPESLVGQVLTINGNALSRYCTATDAQGQITQAMVAGTCLGYVAATIDIMSSGGSVNGFRGCVPSNADMNQIIDIVKKYIQDHAEKRHLLATRLVA